MVNNYVTFDDVLKNPCKKVSVEEGKKIAVELNGAIISKINYKRKHLKNNDKLEIVYFIGGG